MLQVVLKIHWWFSALVFESSYKKIPACPTEYDQRAEKEPREHVEDFTLKIILPEGCTVGKFDSPYPIERLPDTLHYTYLDIKGRPVVTIKNVGDLTEKNIKDFELAFKFSK